eukprot:365661-Chlamydomonas_euryale.AAC.69
MDVDDLRGVMPRGRPASDNDTPPQEEQTQVPESAPWTREIRRLRPRRLLTANRACDARVLGARFMALLPGSDVRSHDGRSPSLSNGVEPVMSTARVRAVIPTYWTRRLSWKAAKEEAGKLRDAAAVGPVSSRRASGCRATAPVTVTRQLGPTLCRGRPRRGPFPFGER